MIWGMHAVYIFIILLLVALLWVTWRAHARNGTTLLSVNCLVAEMFLDESRYKSLKLIFETFMNDKRQPINQSRKDNVQNSTYWISTAFQVEKATQTLMMNEAGDGYLNLAHALRKHFVKI